MFRICVVGCNGIVKKWIDALLTREDARIAALVDVVPSIAEAAKAAYGLDAPVFASLAGALAGCAFDVVLDATPESVHHSIVTQGLRAGKHVLGEKPMSDSMENARDMVATADQSGKFYFVMQNRRFLHGMRTLRAQLDAGEAGTPYLVCADMFLGAHFTGFRNTMEHPLLVDMLIHTFDQARYLLGNAKCLSAYCQEFNPPASWYQGDAIALCTFEMEGGVLVSLRGSWATRSENTSSHGAWRVYGTEGTACWDGYNRVWINRGQPVPPNLGYYEEEGLRQEVALLTEGRQDHAGCIDAMLDALGKGVPAPTDCHDNIHSLVMVYACIESSRTGRKVPL